MRNNVYLYKNYILYWNINVQKKRKGIQNEEKWDQHRKDKRGRIKNIGMTQTNIILALFLCNCTKCKYIPVD